MLLDPSCSGSGIVNRFDALIDSQPENIVDDTSNEKTTLADRLENLAQFQESVLAHAIKCSFLFYCGFDDFVVPNVKKISYSTCSIHARENELVVLNTLMAHPDWTLDMALPQWPHRGSAEGINASLYKSLQDISGLCQKTVRCLPERDKTNGFYVACFIKKPIE
jgi:putative methyltransferase